MMDALAGAAAVSGPGHGTRVESTSSPCADRTAPGTPELVASSAVHPKSGGDRVPTDSVASHHTSSVDAVGRDSIAGSANAIPTSEERAISMTTATAARASQASPPRHRVAVVLPAAGSGLRAGTPTAKQFWPVENNPLLFFTLTTLEKAAGVHSIVCPTTAADVAALQLRAAAEWSFRKVTFVAGGATRHRSIAAGVAAVPLDVDVIVVHDAVRPFVRCAHFQTHSPEIL